MDTPVLEGDKSGSEGENIMLFAATFYVCNSVSHFMYIAGIWFIFVPFSKKTCRPRTNLFCFRRKRNFSPLMKSFIHQRKKTLLLSLHSLLIRPGNTQSTSISSTVTVNEIQTKSGDSLSRSQKHGSTPVEIHGCPNYSWSCCFINPLPTFLSVYCCPEFSLSGGSLVDLGSVK